MWKILWLLYANWPSVRGVGGKTGGRDLHSFSIITAFYPTDESCRRWLSSNTEKLKILRRTEDPGSQKIQSRQPWKWAWQERATNISQFACFILFLGAEPTAQILPSPRVPGMSASSVLLHPGWPKSKLQVPGRSIELTGSGNRVPPPSPWAEYTSYSFPWPPIFSGFKHTSSWAT